MLSTRAGGFRNPFGMCSADRYFQAPSAVHRLISHHLLCHTSVHLLSDVHPLCFHLQIRNKAMTKDIMLPHAPEGSERVELSCVRLPLFLLLLNVLGKLVLLQVEVAKESKEPLSIAS